MGNPDEALGGAPGSQLRGILSDQLLGECPGRAEQKLSFL